MVPGVCRMSTLGTRIKRLRAEMGATQEETAHALKVSRATLANWEIDRTKPDPQTLALLSRYFGVSVDYLLGIEPPTRERKSPSSPNHVKRLYEVVDRAKELSKEDTDRVAEVLDVLIKQYEHKRT